MSCLCISLILIYYILVSFTDIYKVLVLKEKVLAPHLRINIHAVYCQSDALGAWDILPAGVGAGAPARTDGLLRAPARTDDLDRARPRRSSGGLVRPRRSSHQAQHQTATRRTCGLFVSGGVGCVLGSRGQEVLLAASSSRGRCWGSSSRGRSCHVVSRFRDEEGVYRGVVEKLVLSTLGIMMDIPPPPHHHHHCQRRKNCQRRKKSIWKRRSSSFSAFCPCSTSKWKFVSMTTARQYAGVLVRRTRASGESGEFFST